MPMGVVDILELIEIEKHHGDCPVVPVCKGDRLGQSIVEQFSDWGAR